MSLAALSLYRVTGMRRVPRPPTNDERIAAFRARVPYAPIGTPFRFRSRVYIPRPAFPRPAGTAYPPPIPADGSGGEPFTTRSNP